MSFMGIIDHVKFNFIQSVSKCQPQAQAGWKTESVWTLCPYWRIHCKERCWEFYIPD
jgi:hypothetical protein